MSFIEKNMIVKNGTLTLFKGGQKYELRGLSNPEAARAAILDFVSDRRGLPNQSREVSPVQGDESAGDSGAFSVMDDAGPDECPMCGYRGWRVDPAA